MRSYRINIETVKTILFHSLICMLLVSNSYAQGLRAPINPVVKVLKQQLRRAVSDTAKARLSTEISTYYRLLVENDSCKKYAMLAINITKNLPIKNIDPLFIIKYKKIRAKAMENYASALVYEDATPAIEILQQSMSLWQETGDKTGIAIAYYSLGQAYSFQSEALEAIKCFNKGLTIFYETKNKHYIAETLYAISLEKRYLGMYGDALEYSLKSLKVAEEIKDTLAITNSLLANGFNYMFSKNYSEALQEQKKALKIFEKTKDSVGIATAYSDMAVTETGSGKLQNALKHHQIALKIRKKLGNANDITISYTYIASLHLRQGELNEALEAIKQARQYALQFGDSRFIMDSYLEAGDIYEELNDNDNAIRNYKFAQEVANKNNSQNYEATALTKIGLTYMNAGKIKEALISLDKADQIVLSNDYKNRRSIYKALSEIYVENHNYKNAYENQVRYQQMDDSINAIEKTDKITALTQKLIYDNKYALQKASQDKEIAIQQSQIAKQKLIRNLSIGGLLIGIVLAIIFFIRFKEKRRLNVALEKTLFDLKSTQKQLVQSEKMASLGELTAGIAHEIQNPLNFVNNFSEVSKELLDEMKMAFDNGNTEAATIIANDVIQNLEKINHHGKRADAIVKGMLQHSRSSSGLKELTDLNALCDEYLRLSYHGLRAKDKSFNATIHSDFDKSVGKINIIPQEFGRVILNLLNNAFYAVNQKKIALNSQNIPDYKPTVSIATKRENDKVIVTVTDNGNGIADAVKSKIFQPFFTTKPPGKGTGLGLSMSYDIITKVHNGQLEVISKENEGTTFRIILTN